MYEQQKQKGRFFQKVKGGDIASLIPMLECKENWDRYYAANVLADYGPRAYEAVPALSKALSDPIPVVRAMSAEALGKIGKKAKSAIPSLQQAAEDENEDVSLTAISSLGQIGSRDAVDALTGLLWSQSVMLRCKAAKALVCIGPDASGAIPVLKEVTAQSEGLIANLLGDCLKMLQSCARDKAGAS